MNVLIEERQTVETVSQEDIAAAFSPEMEREVSERVLGSRRHGW